MDPDISMQCVTHTLISDDAKELYCRFFKTKIKRTIVN